MSGAALDPIVEELRERRVYGTNEWADIRTEAAKDMNYVSGKPWDQKDIDARNLAGRPVIVVDEFGQYVNQVINDLRQNKRGIKVTPQGNGANDPTAQFLQGKVRDIEYRSNAQQAYTTMAADAIQRSYGYLRITPVWVNRNGGFHQEPRIEPIVNPDLVLPDPDFLRGDGSDWKWLFYHQQWSTKEFNREFPDAEKKSFEPADGAVPGGWYDASGKRLMIAEYWTREKTSSRRQLLIKPEVDTDEPTEAWDDPKNPVKSDRILNQRDVDQFTVKQYLTNGFEILRTTPWPGQSIPFVGCYGKVLYVAGKRVILSMIRLARDPGMLLNYIRATEMELVGMLPKFPYFFMAGSLSQEALDLLAKSLHEPVAGIPVNPSVPGLPAGTPTPYPTRQQYEPALQQLEIFAESMRRSIQSSMGTGFLPTQAQRQNEKSGKALDRITSSAQKGSFHFTDNYDSAITRTGQINVELIPSYFDTVQDTSIRTPADEVKMVRINDPNPQPGQNGQAEPPILLSKDHVYDVTISVGPAEDSQREAVNDLVQGMVTNAGFMQELGPQKGAKVLALSVKMLNAGPMADAIAEIIDPPQKDGQPTPEQMTQMLQGAKQKVESLEAALGEMNRKLETKQLENESREKIEGAKLDFEKYKFDREVAMKLDIADTAARTKGVQVAHEAEHEAVAMGHQHAFDANQAELDRQHEIQQLARANAHSAAGQAAGTAADADAADQAHGHTLDAQAQAAALAPQPDEDDGA